MSIVTEYDWESDTLKAKATLPDGAGRVDRAVPMVLNHDVELLEDGKAKITSQSNGTVVYHLVKGECHCKDYAKAPSNWCKHRIAAGLYKRATAPGLPPQPLVLIQGKPFVKFSGLLAMAHARGLVVLTADWTYNDAELSLAHAVATFQDGRRFEESGDASPANTTKKVAVHFRRVALTRAKARILRGALGIDLIAVEELADE